MGILNIFNKKNEVKEEIKEEKEEKTIAEQSNYVLAKVNKKEVEESSLTILLKDIVSINSESEELVTLFKNTNIGKNELGQITNMAMIIDFFNDKKNRDSVKKLKKMGFNSATVMITCTLYEIEKDLAEVKEISQNILTFLENDKESQIEGDIKTLLRVINEYKYNWKDEQYIENNHMQVMDIERSAMHNIEFYKKQIREDVSKSNIIVTNKTINSNQDKLENDFTYYGLSLYVYSFATFMEIMLLENFQKDYLLTKKKDLENLTDEYNRYYQDALLFVKKEANKSIEGNLLSHIGTAGKAIGDLTKNVQIIKEKKIDTWFNKNGDNLKNIGENMKNDFSDKFTEMRDANNKIFIDKIDLINNIFNKTKSIYFDKEKIYLELVK